MGNRAHKTEKSDDRWALDTHPEKPEKTEHCWARGAHQAVKAD